MGFRSASASSFFTVSAKSVEASDALTIGEYSSNSCCGRRCNRTASHDSCSQGTTVKRSLSQLLTSYVKILRALLFHIKWIPNITAVRHYLEIVNMNKQESSAKLTNQRFSYAFTSSPFSFHACHILPASKFKYSCSCILLIFYRRQ